MVQILLSQNTDIIYHLKTLKDSLSVVFPSFYKRSRHGGRRFLIEYASLHSDGKKGGMKKIQEYQLILSLAQLSYSSEIIQLFDHSILLFTIMVEKMELRNNFFSTSFPIPRLETMRKSSTFLPRWQVGVLETMILFFSDFLS